MTAPGPVRVGWPDVAKGICIILVVLWHVVTKHAVDLAGAGAVTDLWVTLNAQLLPLRIPLFFLVSGVFAARAVLDRESISWRRRAARLALLYVVWVLIQTFVLALTPDFDTARATSGWELIAQLTISPTNLWYLLALAVYLAIGRLTRALPTVVVLPVAFVIAAVAGTGLIPDLGNLWQLVQNLFFFLVGLRLRAVVERFAKDIRAVGALALAVVYVGALAIVAVLGIRLWLGVWPALALLAVALGVASSVLLDRHVGAVARPLRWIGRRTLPIYVLHMMPLAFIDAGLRAAGWRTSPVLEAVGPVLLTGVVIATCLGVQALLVRVGLGALFDPLQVTDRLAPRLVR
ncbi:acyltransferase family protein [Microbacterium sp. MYb62]|uniref:acyltransferase family protein n=1 Tax=Microbacterium sp. MYb62 TaxID=1848690 RepID=UPI000CFC7445|nr:acyltransferase family protein [Microbacterium sp. MYb62]PRB14850.1 pyridoxal-5'-phosphate-dependent protein subunit beta [Microbacterium sp. MYb62]